MAPLSLPLFVGPGVAGEPVDIGELATHDVNVRRKIRSDKIETMPLFNPLFLLYRS